MPLLPIDPATRGLNGGDSVESAAAGLRRVAIEATTKMDKWHLRDFECLCVTCCMTRHVMLVSLSMTWRAEQVMQSPSKCMCLLLLRSYM